MVPSMIEHLKPEHLVRGIAGSFWLFSGAELRRDKSRLRAHGSGLTMLNPKRTSSVGGYNPLLAPLHGYGECIESLSGFLCRANESVTQASDLSRSPMQRRV